MKYPKGIKYSSRAVEKKADKMAICMLVMLTFFLSACSQSRLFSGYRKESFDITSVSEKKVKTVQLLNNSSKDVQHIISIAFYANSNKTGHFQVTSAKVGTEKVGQKDIFVPPMGVLNLEITYAPLDLDSTDASFGGWVTTEESRFEPVDLKEFYAEEIAAAAGAPVPEAEKAPEQATEQTTEPATEKGALLAMTKMAGLSAKTNSADTSEKKEEAAKAKSEEFIYDPAIHRAMLIVAYDEPREGYNEIELVGGAIPGSEGEATAVGMGSAGGGGDCTAGGTAACFNGTFAIDLPGLMKGGAVEVPMKGSIPLTIEAGSAKLKMDEFPPILIALKGNGPGEPLEGKPVDAISIIISGTEGVESVGSFDGQNLSLSGVSFRVRVELGELTYEDITPGLATAVDFNIPDLELTTDEPFDGSKIIFGTETTLSATPSNNGLFDAFLGNARVVVKFKGMLELP